MKYLTLILLFAVSLTATAQDYPDSLSSTINTINDSTYTVSTFVVFEGDNGEKSTSTITSSYLDSAGVATYILSADLRGLRANRTRVHGRRKVAEIAQEFFITSKAVGQVFPDLFEAHTGIAPDEIDIGLDNLFVGDWQFTEAGNTSRVDFQVVRRSNGRFAAVTEDGGTKAYTYSQNEIAIRNFGDLQTGILSFYRVKQGDNTFKTIDGQYIIRKLYTR